MKEYLTAQKEVLTHLETLNTVDDILAGHSVTVQLSEKLQNTFEQTPRKRRVYVAGPMRGIPEFNFPAFNAAAAALRSQGWTVFNPAEKDNERHGTDISKGNVTGDEAIATAQHGFNLREALGLDLAYICAEADAVALLPGWENSKGATAEHATALALGLEILEL